MNEMSEFYTYIYLDPRKHGKYIYGKYEFEYEPFYVGKGKNGQWKRISGRTKYFKRIINKIKESGLEPIVIKFKDDMIEVDSFLLEIKLIEAIGRQESGKGPLVNFTDGGEGTSGYIFKQEIIEIISKKRRKEFITIKDEFKRREYNLLTKEEDYKNNRHTKLEYICPKGHKHLIRWNNFQKGNGCLICGTESMSKKRRKISMILGMDLKEVVVVC